MIFFAKIFSLVFYIYIYIYNMKIIWKKKKTACVYELRGTRAHHSFIQTNLLLIGTNVDFAHQKNTYNAFTEAQSCTQKFQSFNWNLNINWPPKYAKTCTVYETQFRTEKIDNIHTNYLDAACFWYDQMFRHSLEVCTVQTQWQSFA